MNMKIRAGTAQDLDWRNTLNNKHRESVFSFSTPCDFFHVSKQVDFHTGLAGACIVLASRWKQLFLHIKDKRGHPRFAWNLTHIIHVAAQGMPMIINFEFKKNDLDCHHYVTYYHKSLTVPVMSTFEFRRLGHLSGRWSWQRADMCHLLLYHNSETIYETSAQSTKYPGINAFLDLDLP